MADPNQPDLSYKKLTRPNPGQTILTRTHHLQKVNFDLNYFYFINKKQFCEKDKIQSINEIKKSKNIGSDLDFKI